MIWVLDKTGEQSETLFKIHKKKSGGNCLNFKGNKTTGNALHLNYHQNK